MRIPPAMTLTATILALGLPAARAQRPAPEGGKATAGDTAAPANGKATPREKPADASKDGDGKSARDGDKLPTFEEREEAALAFVRQNHPELASLLEQLKAMKPEQYQRAVAELWTVSRNLAAVKKNDERRYKLALEAWKARSRAELLAAEMVDAPSADRKKQLRAAIETQIDVEIRQQRLERELAEARVRRAGEAIERLKSKRDELVESRYQTLLKKGRRTRRLEAGREAAPRPGVAKGEDER